MGMSDYHEPSQELSAEDRDLHRALTSFKEEIEAVDWYHQRVSLATDESLRSVLAHNRDEEIEHACMTLEWLRRHVPEWNRHLSSYLFTSGDIARLENRRASRRDSGRGLGVGALSPSETEAGTGMEQPLGSGGGVDGNGNGNGNGRGREKRGNGHHEISPSERVVAPETETEVVEP